MKSKIPDSFVEAMKDIVRGKTVPLDKALNEKPSFNWKDAHDLQQKLVISYTLENEKLKDRIKELEKPSEKVDKICNQIQDIYDKKEYYRMHNHILQAANDELDRANKMMKDTLINIRECFEIRSEIYHNDWVGLQDLANKARICLECIGYEWEIAPSGDLSQDKAPGS
jgi:predicted RNase H-like nuclease (RuvC/YqgF family)